MRQTNKYVLKFYLQHQKVKRLRKYWQQDQIKKFVAAEIRFVNRKINCKATFYSESLR